MNDIFPQPRANRDGDPCPAWCVQDHDELLIAGKPEFGYMDGHVSDPITGQLGLKAEVLLRRYGTPAEPVRVHVSRYAMPVLDLAADKAVVLAALLESLSTKYDLEQLADELRAAAAIAQASA